MEEQPIWNNFAEMLGGTFITDWLQTVDVLSVVLFTCGVTLFYLVMNMALRIFSLLFWPAVVVIGLLFFRNESFAALVTESVKRISQSALHEMLPAQ